MSLSRSLALLFFKRSVHIGKYPFMMIAFATALVIVITALAEGFDRELVTKLVGVTSHIEITTTDGFGFTDYEGFVERIAKRHSKTIAGIAPRFVTDAILSADGMSAGVRVIGIDPSLEPRVSAYLSDAAGRIDAAPRRVAIPDFPFGEAASRTSENGLATGAALYKKLGLAPGRRVKLSTLSREAEFLAAATFEIGIHDYDMSFVFCDIRTLCRIMKFEGTATSVLIRLHDIRDADAFAKELRAELKAPGIMVRTWREANRNLFSTIMIERAVLGVIVLLTLILASIGIAFIVALNVFRRARSIAIMDALGTPADAVRRAFMMEGFMFGLSGLAAGIAAGVAGAWLLAFASPGLPEEIKIYYSVSRLPVAIDTMNIITVAAVEIVVLAAACWLSARSVSKAELLETLRNN